MKELVFKNLTSDDNRIKNVSTTEIMRHKDILVESTRDTKYLIHVPVKSHLRLSSTNTPRKPQIYILKNIDTRKNTKKFCLKVTGREFKVFKENLYPVDYEHSFTLEIVHLNKG